jgi:Recombinase zinc beta ribbon domain/HNH endonuclease
VDIPELRIVDETVWQRAHERLDAGRALYFARAGERGRAGGRPPSGSASRYLLSGLGTCACCQGSMFVHARGDRPPRWGCMTRHLRGQAVCANALEVRLDDTDAAVLEAVECQLLKVAVLETALYKALAAFEAPQDDAGTGLRDELARLDDEVAQLADAIARGGALESLLGMLQDREQRRAHLRVALAEHERQQAAQRQPVDALALMRAALTDWQGLLRQETGPARTALQALLRGRLAFPPPPGPEGYTFSGVGTVAPIIAGVVPNGIGARTRTIPAALRRALHRRDGGCRFPGCGVPFGQGHHLRHWAQGGPTALSNLALLCRRHRRAVHEEGYHVRASPTAHSGSAGRTGIPCLKPRHRRS